ncbi:MAG: glutamine-hydrolyzing carbamoyl-phosphate synthase small subunit [Pseudomonadota bacterium]
MKLHLEDGTMLSGTPFGADAAVAGEVVFNTAMTGYVETLTDPSYRGQLLVMTFPLPGNYGVPPAPAPAAGALLPRPFEAGRIQVQGLIVQNYVSDFSHHEAARSLQQWLIDDGVPAITGIDTRRLTRRLREAGTMPGLLLPEAMSVDDGRAKASAVDMRAAVFRDVAPQAPVRYEGGDFNVLLIDIGAKENIVRSLLERGASVTRIPWHADLEQHAASADGIVIGNGPGNPKDLTELIDALAGLLKHFRRPVFGICMGHQILSLAAGGDTFKLPYGHRGVNQPVQDLLTRRCYITSQNHGYAVSDESLPAGWEPWFVNVNDGTNEGVRSLHRPFFSVQFHPEASPGPRDAGHLFDDFLRLVGAHRGEGS